MKQDAHKLKKQEQCVIMF